jgi:hypothetical protein
LPVESLADTVIVCMPVGVPGVLGALDVVSPLDEALDPPQPESEIKNSSSHRE